MCDPVRMGPSDTLIWVRDSEPAMSVCSRSTSTLVSNAASTLGGSRKYPACHGSGSWYFRTHDLFLDRSAEVIGIRTGKAYQRPNWKERNQRGRTDIKAALGDSSMLRSIGLGGISEIQHVTGLYPDQAKRVVCSGLEDGRMGG
jgi:hypothetical protein